MILRAKKEGEFYGFADMAGDWIIKPRFEDVDVFREGVCWVKSEGKWGLIDPSGSFLIPPRFEGAREFNDGLANVKTGAKWGVIDREGNLVVNPEFDYIDSFKEGVAYVKNEGKYGFVFLENGRLIKPEFDDVRGFSEGMAAVKIGSLWGYVNSDGVVAIAPAFDSAEKFKNGRAFVTKGGLGGYIDMKGIHLNDFEELDFDDDWAYELEPWYDSGTRTLHGFIDRKGNYVVRPKFRAARSFSAGTAMVKIDRKWGLIDTTGTYLIEPQYKSAEALEKALRNGEAGITLPGRRNRGKDPFNFDPEEPFELDEEAEFTVFSSDGKKGVRGKNGNVVIPPVYEKIIWNPEVQVFTVKFGEKLDSEDPVDLIFNYDANMLWGIIARDGTVIKEPSFGYHDSYGYADKLIFCNGLAAVQEGDKWGFIGPDGNFAIEPSFDGAQNFRNGLAKVWKGRKTGLIDPTGRYIVKPCCTHIRLSEGLREIEDGYINATISFNEDGTRVEKSGVFDRNGTPVVPFVFDDVFGSMAEGMARVRLEEEFGFADCRSGAFIEPIYDFVWDFADGLAHVRVTEKQIEEGILDEENYSDSDSSLLDSFKSFYDKL